MIAWRKERKMKCSMLREGRLWDRKINLGSRGKGDTEMYEKTF